MRKVRLKRGIVPFSFPFPVRRSRNSGNRYLQSAWSGTKGTITAETLPSAKK
ncbi:hypothetical protein JOD44_002153 [Salimicrobium jeotgali]|uniref:hypothetical protein n=1 Tax=Salimicrobium jeotgali TaxID=1230341 RepID=UPI0003200BC8|nr:hypothetical protein [Salimicrobium jeotgali]MBM7697010.1 hypothetical protein [Salimicrobium jeotgali]